MRKAIYSLIYCRLPGWKTNMAVPKYDKCVVYAAPHTTNLDLFIGKLFYGAMGGKISFVMRKERSLLPLEPLFRAVGGTFVGRSCKTLLVEQMAHHSNTSEKFHLVITLGGMYKRNPNWRKGFCYITLKAQISIVLVGIDHTTKTTTSTKAVMPGGGIDEDMCEIKFYFKDFKGKRPKNFSIGNVERFTKILIVQTGITWENKQENLRLLREKLLPLRRTTEIAVLLEMLTMGLNMNSRVLTELISDFTTWTLKGYVAEFQSAPVGSLICEGVGAYYNRVLLIIPDGQELYCDKYHLFHMGCETEHFPAGNRRVTVSYRGWNVCLQVCYDLRFPVRSRNINNEYDLLIYIASWPTPRVHAWNTLLCTRAIKNQCYACGVGRIGRDGNGLHYPGYSALYSPKDEMLTGILNLEEKIQTIEFDIEALTAFRHKLPSWRDADPFLLY